MTFIVERFLMDTKRIRLIHVSQTFILIFFIIVVWHYMQEGYGNNRLTDNLHNWVLCFEFVVTLLCKNYYMNWKNITKRCMAHKA